MENLRIQCRPINFFGYPESMGGTWVRLDSLLHRAVLLEQYGHDYYCLPSVNRSSAELESVALPLERRAIGEQWYWACSWANVEANSLHQDVSAWVRGYPEHDAVTYLNDKKKLLIKTWQGEDKLYNIPVHTHVIDTLTWYAVGDKAEIKRLLETHYHAIGKKTAYGQGQLEYYPDGSRWQVESWAHDWSERDGQGNLTRALPIDVQSKFPVDMARAAIRPPYYVDKNFTWVTRL